MSGGYEGERAAIERYFAAKRGSATEPIIWDAQEGTPVENSFRLTINSGRVLQGTIGRIANRIDHIGTLTVTIYTAGGTGSAKWRGYAETIIGYFFETTLTESGTVITSSADSFVRFSPPQLGESKHPYIAASFADPPFHITNVICPYIRYSYK